MRALFPGLLLLLLLLLLPSPAPAQSEAVLDSIAPSLWVIRHEAPASKTVIAEFARFLAVIESPGDDGMARAVLAALDAKFPTKPVRFLLHTHPHGHSLGAIDPYLVRGVTFVTTDANLARVKNLSSDPERVQRTALIVDDGFSIADATNVMNVRVLEREEYQTPTDDYAVFEFPHQQLLVSGCLYNKPLTYHEVVNARKPGLHRFLDQHAVDVVTLLPTNTTTASGFEDLCTVEMLQTTLREGIDPNQVADRLAAMSLAEIESSLDALATEFGARTPRSFDLLVCGNTLRSQREDAARAALWFEMAQRVFPDDSSVAYYLGVAHWENAQPERAEQSWARALTLTEESDRPSLMQDIEAVKAAD